MLEFIRIRLRNVLESLAASFWILPTAMCLGAFALFWLGLRIDREHQLLTFMFVGGLEPVSATGARVILSTIAGSMITIAGTVFSITIVTLTLATNQFGPGLLRDFISDKSNQLVLGSFISTFVYSLCALSSVQPDTDPEFVPRVSVNIAVLLALSNVGVLIYFIHHVANSIQAERVIRSVAEKLIRQIQYSFDAVDDQEKESKKPANKTKEWKSAKETEVEAMSWGYLQAIDNGTLMKLATKHNLVIELQQKPGNYIAQDELLAVIKARSAVDEKTVIRLRKAFLVGTSRSPEQDVEYAIHQLVEIALRALSPGVNDPYTALACIDHLSTALSMIVNRRFPAKELTDEKGFIRIIRHGIDFSAVLGAAFNQIRQHGHGNAAVLIRLLEAICVVRDNTEDSGFHKVLLEHGEMIRAAAKETILNTSDLADLDERWKTLKSE